MVKCPALYSETKEIADSTNEVREMFQFYVGDQDWAVDVRIARRISPLFARKYDSKKWEKTVELNANVKAFQRFMQFFSLDEVQITLDIALGVYRLATEFEINDEQVRCIREFILAHSHLIDVHQLHHHAQLYMDDKLLFHTAAELLRDPFDTFKLPLTTFQFDRYLFNAKSHDDEKSRIQFRINSHAVLVGLEVAIPWLGAPNSFEYAIIIDEIISKSNSRITIREMKLPPHSANDKGMIQFDFDAVFINPIYRYSIKLVEKRIPLNAEYGEEQLYAMPNQRLFVHYSRAVNGCRLRVFDNDDDEEKAYSRFSKLNFYPFQYRHEHS